MIKNQLKKDQKLAEKRESLRQEYREKVECGEIRPPSRIERLKQTARGHDDNESVQAARKILKKRGEEW